MVIFEYISLSYQFLIAYKILQVLSEYYYNIIYRFSGIIKLNCVLESKIKSTLKIKKEEYKSSGVYHILLK